MNEQSALETASTATLQTELERLRDLLGQLVPGFAQERVEVRLPKGSPSAPSLLWSVVGSSPALKRFVPPPARDGGRATVLRTLASWASRSQVVETWGSTPLDATALPSAFRLVSGGSSNLMVVADESEGRADPRVVCLTTGTPDRRTVHTSYVQFVVQSLLWAAFGMTQRWSFDLTPAPGGVSPMPLIAPGLTALAPEVWSVRPLSYGVRELSPPKAYLGARSFPAFVHFLATLRGSVCRWFEPKYPAATTDLYAVPSDAWARLLPTEIPIERSDGPMLEALHAGRLGETPVLVVRPRSTPERVVLVTEDAPQANAAMRWLREQGLDGRSTPPA